MITFAFVEPKKTIDTTPKENSSYFYEKINELMVNTIFQERTVKEVSYHYCYFEVVSKSRRRYDVWFRLFPINNITQIIIDIKPLSRIGSEYDEVLQHLKFAVKETFKRDWRHCIWLEDLQSLGLAQSLYSQIYFTENLLRHLVNLIMVNDYGVNWWDSFVSHNLIKKYKQRNVSYKRMTENFADVFDYLISIDVDDLMEIIKIKHKKWKSSPEHEETINQAIREGNPEKLFSLISKQMFVEVDIWETSFSPFLPESFGSRTNVVVRHARQYRGI